MNNIVKKPTFSVAIKSEAYQNLINNTLGDKKVAMKFVADISTVVANNASLKQCDPATILSAGLTAQSLNLPLAPTLGCAYIIPYNTKNGWKAQFQIGWKAYVQLAQRSGQYESIGVREVHKGEYVGQDEFGEDIFKFSHDFDNEEVIGYFAYFKLINGFKKTLYWTKEQCEKHGRTYSKAYNAQWEKQFDAMAKKTVLKQLISRYGVMSLDIQEAVRKDQAVVNSFADTVEYADNPEVDVEETKPVENSIEFEEDENGEIIDEDFDPFSNDDDAKKLDAKIQAKKNGTN